jgi:hypothetical protein
MGPLAALQARRKCQALVDYCCGKYVNNFDFLWRDMLLRKPCSEAFKPKKFKIIQ